MGTKNIVESIVVQDTAVELEGSFGRVVLDRSKLTAEISGSVWHGYILRRMVIKSGGKRYFVLLTDERLFDDSVVDLLWMPAGATITAADADDERPAHGARPEHPGNLVYRRRIVELYATIAMVVLGVVMVAIKNDLIENRWAITYATVFTFAMVWFNWTKGPTLRRIEIIDGVCTINYWGTRHTPKMCRAPIRDVVLRTIVCKINGNKRVVDLLRVDQMPFFLVRFEGRLSQWKEADAAALRSSGITVIGD